MSKVWQFKEAECHFGEVVECALKQGAQTITKHGKPVVVVVSVDEYRQLWQPKPSLLELLRSCPEDLSRVVSLRRNPTFNPWNA